jgi:hypothetical protein
MEANRDLLNRWHPGLMILRLMNRNTSGRSSRLLEEREHGRNGLHRRRGFLRIRPSKEAEAAEVSLKKRTS